MLALAAALRVFTALSDVQACLVAPDGAQVIATGGGLAVVGGDVLTALDGLPGTRAHALAADGAGALLVGTEGGLARVERRGRRLEVVAAWPSAPVRALARDGDTVWLATWGEGLRALRGGRLRSFAGPRRLTSVVVHDGVVHAGTAGEGIHRLEGEALSPSGLVLPSPVVFALASRDGRLLAGTAHGLFAGGAFVGGADVRALHGDRVGTFGDGLFRLEGARLLPVAGAPAYVTALGDGCVGGPHGLAGVSLPGPPSNDLSALAVEGGRVWVGTFDRGLALLERGAWRTFDDAGVDPRVNHLALQGRRLFVATARGLFVREGDRFRRVEGLPSDDVHAVLPLADGRVAVGTSRGAALLRGRRVTPLGPKQGLPVAGAVWALAESGDGSLWLGTSRGLYRVPRRGRFTRLSAASGHLPDDWITALAVHEGAVYAGTYRAGVVRLSGGGGAGWKAERLGGGYVNFHGLRVEEGRLHAATMHGLLACALDAAAWEAPPRSLGPDVTALAAGCVATRRGLTCDRAPGAAPGR